MLKPIINRKEIKDCFKNEIRVFRAAPIMLIISAIVLATPAAILVYWLSNEDRSAKKETITTLEVHNKELRYDNRHLRQENAVLTAKLEALRSKQAVAEADVTKLLSPTPMNEPRKIEVGGVRCSSEGSRQKYVVCSGPNGDEIFVRADIVQQWTLELIAPASKRPLDIRSPVMRLDMERRREGFD